MIAAELRVVTKSYQEGEQRHDVLRGVDLELAAGEVLVRAGGREEVVVRLREGFQGLGNVLTGIDEKL